MSKKNSISPKNKKASSQGSSGPSFHLSDPSSKGCSGCVKNLTRRLFTSVGSVIGGYTITALLALGISIIVINSVLMNRTLSRLSSRSVVLTMKLVEDNLAEFFYSTEMVVKGLEEFARDYGDMFNEDFDNETEFLNLLARFHLFAQSGHPKSIFGVASLSGNFMVRSIIEDPTERKYNIHWGSSFRNESMKGPVVSHLIRTNETAPYKIQVYFKSFDPRFASYYRKALSNQSCPEIDELCYNDYTMVTRMFSYVVTKRYFRDGDLQGIVLAYADSTRVSNVLEEVPLNAKIVVWELETKFLLGINTGIELVGKDRIPVDTLDDADITLAFAQVGKSLDPNSTEVQNCVRRNNLIYFKRISFGSKNLGVMIVSEKSTVYSEFEASLGVSTGISSFILFVTCVATIIFGQMVALPLKRVVIEMKKVEQLELDQLGGGFPVFYELSQIKHGFWVMVEMIKLYKKFLPAEFVLKFRDDHSSDASSKSSGKSHRSSREGSANSSIASSEFSSSGGSTQSTVSSNAPISMVSKFQKNFHVGFVTVMVIYLSGLDDFLIPFDKLMYPKFLEIFSTLTDKISEIVYNNGGVLFSFDTSCFTCYFDLIITPGNQSRQLKDCVRAALAIKRFIDEQFMKTLKLFGSRSVKATIVIRNCKAVVGVLGGSKLLKRAVVGRALPVTKAIAGRMLQIDHGPDVSIYVNIGLECGVFYSWILKFCDLFFDVKEGEFELVYKFMAFKQDKSTMEWMYSLEAERKENMFEGVSNSFRDLISSDEKKDLEELDERFKELATAKVCKTFDGKEGVGVEHVEPVICGRIVGVWNTLMKSKVCFADICDSKKMRFGPTIYTIYFFK